MSSTIKYKTIDELLNGQKPKIIGGMEFYTPRQVAKLIGVHERTMVRYINEGKLEEVTGATHIRHPFNNRILIPRESVIKCCEYYLRLSASNKSNMYT